MAYPYAGDPDNYPEEIHPPDDADNARDAATWQVPYEELADRTGYVPVTYRSVTADGSTTGQPSNAQISLATATPRGSRMVVVFFGKETDGDLIGENAVASQGSTSNILFWRDLVSGVASSQGVLVAGVFFDVDLFNRSDAETVILEYANLASDALAVAGLFSGVMQGVTPTWTVRQAFTATSVTSDTIAVTRPGSMIVDCVWSESESVTPTPGAGQTSIFSGGDDGTTIGMHVSYKACPTTGNYTMSWTGLGSADKVYISVLLDPIRKGAI